MKHVKLLSVIAVIVIIFALLSIYAQGAGAQTEGNGSKNKFQQRREEIFKLIKENKDTLAQRLSLRAQNVNGRIEIREKRLSEIIAILDRINEQIEQSGKDTTKASEFLQKAHVGLTAVQTLYAEAEEIFHEFENSNNLRRAASDYQAKVIEIYKEMKLVREDLYNAITELKLLKEQ